MIPLESCSPSSVHRGPRQQQITEEERQQRHARWERGRRGSWVVTNFQATWQIANRVPSPGPGFCQPQQGCLEPGGAVELPQLCPLIGPRPILSIPASSLAARLIDRGQFSRSRTATSNLASIITTFSTIRSQNDPPIAKSLPVIQTQPVSMAAEQRKLLGTSLPFTTPRPPMTRPS